VRIDPDGNDSRTTIMSDASQGPGWWQASDGKWYPPEQAPSYQAPIPQPTMGQPGPGGAAMTTPGVSPYGPLAEWSQRAVGFLIDIGIVIAVGIVGFIITAIVGVISNTLAALVGLVFYLIYSFLFLYFGYLVGVKGRSPGMALTGLTCVSEETGQVIGGGMGIVRSIAHIIDSFICYVGWFFPLWDAKRQTIADKVIKTYVLSGQPKAQFGPDIFKP